MYSQTTSEQRPQRPQWPQWPQRSAWSPTYKIDKKFIGTNCE